MHTILVTENKSRAAPVSQHGMVRVFIDNDFHYGYFVPENEFFNQLNENGQAAYFASESPKLVCSSNLMEWVKKNGLTR
jgi:hypothetical protein